MAMGRKTINVQGSFVTFVHLVFRFVLNPNSNMSKDELSEKQQRIYTI